MRVSRAVGVRVFVSMRVSGVNFLAWDVFLSVDEDIDFRRGDAAAIDTRDLEFRAELESANGFAQQVGRHSGVDERAEKHVAADSAETVEVRDAHRDDGWRRRGAASLVESLIIEFSRLRVKPARLL